MPKLIVPGKTVGVVAEDASSRTFGDILKVELAQRVEIDSRQVDALARSARGQGEEVDPGSVMVDVEDDTLVEIELANGIRITTLAAQARRDFAGQTQRSGGQTLDIPPVFNFGQATRGVGDWVLKGLRFFDVRPDEEIAKGGAKLLADKLEGRIGRPEGLYRFTRLDEPEPVAIGPDDIPADRDILLLIHGTASMTSTSFGGLSRQIGVPQDPDAPAIWDRLKQRYGDHIYGFDHRTLSASPIRNAINLVKSLPVGARLHMVGYSRGGLVGELIARVNAEDLTEDGNTQPRADAFDEIDLDFFRKWKGDAKWADANPDAAEEIRNTREQDAEDLKELNALLKERSPRVERFIRVGCPASGTTLASGRLDIYLSIIVNLIEKIPFLKDNPFYELMTALLQAFVKMRTDPRVIPGLEAQMPESPLINMLNRQDIRIGGGPLGVIAGDIEPSGFLNSLKVFATDMYYWDEHDLVVKTSEMLGGGARGAGIRYFFDKGAEVNHFSYFSNARTNSRMFAALAGDLSGFKTYEPHRPLVAAARAPSVQRDRREVPTVFVLPGIMGSHIEERSRRLWLHYRRLAFGAIETLADLNNPHLAPGDPVDSYYGDLIQHLAKDNFVIPFPYDWRKPISQEALRLADEVEVALQATTRPIRFLAHSMGGLVVRTMMAERSETWHRVKGRDGARFVMLGTPNGGSHAIVTQLVGRAGTINKLHLLDITHSKREVLGFLQQIPGILELLPDGAAQDFFRREAWQRLHAAYDDDWEVPADTALDAARGLRDILARPESRDDAITCYIAGKAAETPVDVVPDTTFFGRRRLKVMATPQGDGQVPWSTGIIDQSRTWYADVEHGALSSHSPDFPAISELLDSGKTNRLPTQPDAATRGAERQYVMSDEALEGMASDEFDLLPMGGAVRRPKTAAAAVARVEILHANLAFCDEVITVGHYENDLLLSAEKYIDSRLENRLSMRRALGLYPGALNTADVIFNRSEHPEDFQGALIAGLGRYGSLTIEALTQTLTHAFLHFALKMCERQRDGAKEPLSLGTLLIGHSESRLTLSQSLRAILEALIRANEQIDLINRTDRSIRIERIEKLKLVELLEGTAIQAASALMSARDDPAFKGKLDIDPCLRSGRGGLRYAEAGDGAGYLQRVQIEMSHEDENALSFTSHGDYALAAKDLHVQDRSMIDRLIDDMTSSTVRRGNISELLFELLVPQGLKKLASEHRDLLFIVDETAAAYPWELLDNKFSNSDRPIAVRTKFTRQLIQPRDRIGRPAADLRGVLVIGDPRSVSENGFATPMFQPLPGAQEEASRVAQIFERSQRWKVQSLIRPDASSVLEEVMLGRHKILHLAGHGVYDYGMKRHTGMVLGNDVFLSPAIVKALSHVPEFVFLNCCYLGKIAKLGEDRAAWLHRHRLAANLGVAFMQAGAKAVIAAGWEVDDGPAKEFATAFYSQMVEADAPFAEAVRRGRQAAYDANPNSNTWGAYQSYGDPSYRFKTDTTRKRSGGKRYRFAAKSQAIDAIFDIGSQADTARNSDSDRLSRDLDAAVADLHEDWRQDARLNDVLGSTYANLLRFEEAIACFDTAAMGKTADFSVRAVEQRANLRARVAGMKVIAAEQAQEGVSAARSEARRDIGQSIRELKDLNTALGETVERLRLIASGYKRKCLTRTFGSASDFKDLAQMFDHYLRAYRASVADDDAGCYDPDPVLNAHSALILLRMYPGRAEARDDVSDLLAEQRAEAETGLPAIDTLLARLRTEAVASRSFWDLAMIGDAVMLKHLGEGTISEHAPDVIRAYQRAWENGGHGRNRSSIIETVDFLRIMIARIETDAEQARVSDAALSRIGRALQDLQVV